MTTATDRTRPAKPKGEAKAAKQAALAAEIAGKKIFTAKTADRHELYQLSVQNVEAEIDFVDATFEEIRGRNAVSLRRGLLRHGQHVMRVGPPPRDQHRCRARHRPAHPRLGARAQRGPPLPRAAGPRQAHQPRCPRARRRDRVEIILAMNFSYWLFQKREQMVGYFKTVRESLANDGVFFLDHYGGAESQEETTDKRPIEGTDEHGPFTYIWDQHEYNPITGEMECRIHFKFETRPA